jgi:hypothetical protein
MSNDEREDFLRSELMPLEYLADIKCLNIGALRIIAGISGISGERAGSAAWRALALEHLNHWGFAAGLIFLLYEFFSRSSAVHPPASHRALLASSAIQLDIPELNLHRAAIAKSINLGIQEVQRTWDALNWSRDKGFPKDLDAFLKPIMAVEARCKSPPCAALQRSSTV